jgi:tetratricopeptide (TPR) repeat protein
LCDLLLEQSEAGIKAAQIQGTLEEARNLRRGDDPLQASRLLIKIIRQDPTHHYAYAELAVSLFTLGLMDRAIGAFREAVRIKDDNELYYVNFSAILHHAGHFEECIRIGMKALELNPASGLAHMNLGLSHFSLRHWEKGIYHFEHAVQYNPNNSGAWMNLGLGYENLARDEEAEGCFERALKLEPQNSEIKLSLGINRLKNGHFKEGWKYFSSRFDFKPALNLTDNIELWTGQNLSGKTIHLYPEQGLGDLVQFIRFAKTLNDQGARVFATVPRSLKELLATVPGIERCFDTDEQAPVCDFQSTVMELPRWLGIDASNMVLPQGYLEAPALSLEKRVKLESLGDNLKVGVVWAGNPSHINDSRRSMCFDDIAPLLNIDKLTLVNLQMGERVNQLWDHPQAQAVINGAEEGVSALNTASLVKELDLVITVDTFVAHLCGALGVPTWILVARNPDWRWLGKGSESAWYKSVRLFRQDESSSWGPVVTEVIEAIAEMTLDR